MFNVNDFALAAEVIIGGYAILKCADSFKVVNLNNAHGVAVMHKDGTLVETNMDPIELSIARKNLLGALKYMEE